MSARERFLIDILSKYLKVPYIWGGEDPDKGLDCSGLVQLLLKRLDLDPPGDQTAAVLYNYFLKHGRVVSSDESDLGDLAFYGSKEKIGHIGFCLGHHLMIEAGGGDSTTKTVYDAIKRNARVRVKPVTHRSDLVAIIRPYNLAIR